MIFVLLTEAVGTDFSTQCLFNNNIFYRDLKSGDCGM